MVKLRGPLMSVDAKGTLGNTLTYQRGFGKNRATRVPKHRDMQSSKQLTQRFCFQAARDEWAWLSGAEKDDLSDEAEQFQMTGYNLFLRRYLKREYPGHHRLLIAMHEGAGSVITDHSGYNKNGACVGTQWTQRSNGLWVPNLDGVDDYINYGDGASMAPPAITALVWVNPSSVATSGQSVLGNMGGGKGWLICISSTFLRVIIYTTVSGLADKQTTFALSNGSWYQIGFSYSSTTKFRAYAQGNKVSEVLTPTGDMGASVYQMRSGKNEAGWGVGCKGLQSEALIVDKVLSDNEVRDLCIAGLKHHA